MTVIELLENELKRVRKINYKLATRDRKTIQEKDLERYKKEMEDNDKYEMDLTQSLIKLRERIEKPKPKAWGIHELSASIESSPHSFQFVPPTTPVTHISDEEFNRELDESRARMRMTVDESIWRAWSEYSGITGHGVFTSEGQQAIPTPIDEATNERND